MSLYELTKNKIALFGYGAIVKSHIKATSKIVGESKCKNGICQPYCGMCGMEIAVDDICTHYDKCVRNEHNSVYLKQKTTENKCVKDKIDLFGVK